MTNRPENSIKLTSLNSKRGTYGSRGGKAVCHSTFDASEFTEEKVAVLLVTGSEVLRMLQEGSSESDDQSAREIYSTYFTIHSE